MNEEDLIELEVNLSLMLVSGNTHYENDKYTADYISSDHYIEVELNSIPYDDPFRYKLRVFDSDRVDKNIWRFTVFRDYVNFSNTRQLKSSVLYSMLSDYNINNEVKLFIMLLSKLSRKVLNEVLEFIRNNESELYESIMTFFTNTKNEKFI